jgi:hypothetical protein
MLKKVEFDNPTPAEIVRMGEIRKSKKKLSPEDERFLKRLWKRCDYIPAYKVMIEKLLPLVHHNIQQAMDARGMCSDIAPQQDKARHERPLGKSFELLSEAICGRETETDRRHGVSKARGVMAALDNHNENRGRVGTYFVKEITGMASDFYIAELRHDEAGAQPGDAFHSYVSHSKSIPGSGGKTYLDLLSD